MEDQKPFRRRFTKAEKAALVAAFVGSGLSQEQFAFREGIAPSKIARWVQQSQVASQDQGRSRLLEVPNMLAGSPASLYRLRWPQGMVLELNRGFEREEVRALVQLLQSL